MVLALNHYLLRGGELVRGETEYDGIDVTGITKQIPLTSEEKIAKLERAVGREAVIHQNNREFVGEAGAKDVYAFGIVRKDEQRYFIELHLPSMIRVEKISVEHLDFLAVLSKPY
mgnify:CR=1 FL=1